MNYDITIKNCDGVTIAEIATQTPARTIVDRDTGETVLVPAGGTIREAISLVDFAPSEVVEVSPATDEAPAKTDVRHKAHKHWTPQERDAAAEAFRSAVSKKLAKIPGAREALAEITDNG